MRKIKDVGVLKLVQEGDLVNSGNFFVACQCVTADLTEEEITDTVSVIDKILKDYQTCLPTILEVCESRKKIRKQENENKSLELQVKGTIVRFPDMLCTLGILWSIFVLPIFEFFKVFGGICLAIGILDILGCCIYYAIKSDNLTKMKRSVEKTAQEIQNMTIKTDNMELEMSKPFYCATFSQVYYLSKVLTILKVHLQKILIIVSDKTLSPSDKFVKTETLLSLCRQEVSQEVQIAEAEQATAYAKEQAEYAAEQYIEQLKANSEQRLAAYKQQLELEKQTQLLRENNNRTR